MKKMGNDMFHIQDLTPEHEADFLVCLDRHDGELAAAAPDKEAWWRRHRELGVRVKLAVNADGRAVGMIQYGPAKSGIVVGDGLAVVYCIWIPPHKRLDGLRFRGKGVGKALLEAAEADARQAGYTGMAAWGSILPFWMKASWFRRRGYKRVSRQGILALLFKPFRPDAAPPAWPKEPAPPLPAGDRVTVTALCNGWCPAMNMVHHRAERAAALFGDAVVFTRIETGTPETIAQWGAGDAIYIDGRSMRMGPPPAQSVLEKAMAKAVRRRKR